MKTILANVSNTFFVRNFLRTDALRIFGESGKTRLVLLVPGHKLAYYRGEFPHSFLVFEEMSALRVRKKRTEKIFKFLETASIHTRTVWMLNKANLHRIGSRLGFIRRGIAFSAKHLLWLLGRFAFWRKMIRALYAFLPDHSFDAIFEKYQPDLVFLPTMIFAEDYLLLKASWRRGITTVGMTLSWDNFYSKTLLRLHPDWLLVHTDEIRSQAASYGDYPGEKIVVTGIPQYDSYFRRLKVLARAEFIKNLGGDPSKKLLLYAFSGKAGVAIDLKILPLLYEILQENRLTDRIQVLVRPYPRYDFSLSTLRELKEKYGFLVESSVSHVGDGRDSWEFDEKALGLLVSSLAHADIVVTMYSTFFIEAAIFDTPLIGIAFDGEKELDYWSSARRFFDWDHLKEVKELNGIWLVHSQKEFEEAIKRYLAQPSYLSEGRRKIVLKQSQFTDGRSAQRVARTLLGLAEL